MNTKFAVGDKVRSLIGGPEMLVSFVTTNNLGAVAFNVTGTWGGAVAPAVQSPTYTCMWWNAISGTFMQWNFQENMLEDVK